MNGYVTCQKVCELYQKDDQLFQMVQNKDICGKENKRPLMIACTGFLNDQIEAQAKDAGFDLVL